MRNDELYNLHSSLNINIMTKPRRMTCARQVARTGKITNAVKS
jgi:hypothetical protein